MSDHPNHMFPQPLYFPTSIDETEAEQAFYLFPPCMIPVPPESMLFQTSSRAVSRYYTPESSHQPTILTAVPTADPQGNCDNASSAKRFKDEWDRNPETFKHPLLRKFIPN